MNSSIRIYAVAALAAVLLVAAVKMCQSERYDIDIWMEDGALNIAGPARQSTRSEEARKLAFECESYDERWEGRAPKNHNEERMRRSDFERCMSGQLRELRRLERK